MLVVNVKMKTGHVSFINARFNDQEETICGYLDKWYLKWTNADWATSCDFNHLLLINKTITRVGECKTKCIQTPDCTHYSWSPTSSLNRDGDCSHHLNTILAK